MVVDESWRTDLERWLAPFLAGLSHPARRRMCPQYIAGLIGPGDRKSVQPMAARGGEAGYDQLHHFVAAGIWDSAPLEAALLSEADRLVGGAGAFLVIDDTAMPKKGRHSVGVAPQYASSLGKNANCQTLVSVTLASHEVPVMVSLRLFLPESWTSDPERMAKAKVPADRQVALTKPEIAIEEIDRIRAAGVRFSCVLADAGYGMSAPFRQALSARSLSWAVGIPGRQKVYPADVAMIFPVTGPRQASAAPHSRQQVARGGEVVGRAGVAIGQLAAGYQGTAERSLRSDPRPRCRWSHPTHPRHGWSASAGRGGLADRRASLNRRA